MRIEFVISAILNELLLASIVASEACADSFFANSFGEKKKEIARNPLTQLSFSTPIPAALWYIDYT